MVFNIDKPFESERKLSQLVIQVTELLGMYNAELAWILGQQCSDIGELTSGQRCLKRDSAAGQQAVLFIKTYHLLFVYFEGDGVAVSLDAGQQQTFSRYTAFYDCRRG